MSMRRRDLDNNVVEIEHNETTDLWLVVRKVLDASQISLQVNSSTFGNQFVCKNISSEYVCTL